VNLKSNLPHLKSIVALVKKADKADKGVSFSPHLANTRTFELMVRERTADAFLVD